MTRVLRPLVSALRAVLKLFVDDGVYAAVTIAWITAIVVLRPHGATTQTILVVTAGSDTADRFTLGGPLLAFGLDLIFATSVILRLRSTARSRSGKKKA